MQTPDATESSTRLKRLLGFLERDPDNASLLADAAEEAFGEGERETAAKLLARYEAASPLPPPLQNLKGLTALSGGDFATAADIFQALLSENSADPVLRFNLAWAKSMLEDWDGAVEMLDDETAVTVPNAAALKIHGLHHLGRLDEALACGRELARRMPDDKDLMGALANAAIDAEDLALAREYATRAGGQHEGLSALGMVLLNDSDIPAAMTAFEHALEVRPDDARAAVGKGLALMAENNPAKAAPWLDKGAERFGEHLGSWVASAWAYFAAGDLVTSRARFEKALAIDDTFAEIHGGLAVLDIAAGDLESAKRRTEVALRLDRQCFSAALAKSLLLAAEGNAQAAERIRNIALNTPLGQSGKTLMQSMASLMAARKKAGGV
ncbi:MAG: tetratricopeptide repeat protein [Parcubacteria group bacterium]